MKPTFNAPQVAPFQHAVPNKPTKPESPSSGIPLRSRMRLEIAKKKQIIKCLLLRVRRKEKQILQTQAHLDELLAEKARREKELAMVTGLLPKSEDILDLIRRRKKAREIAQQSTKSINDTDAYLSLVDAVKRGKDSEEEKRRREDLKLRRSVAALKNDVANLKAQLNELTNDLPVKAASEERQHLSCKDENICTTRFGGSADISKFLKQKKKLEERVKEAAVAWNMAVEREARAARLLKRLEVKLTHTTGGVLEKVKKNISTRDKPTSKTMDGGKLKFCSLGTALAYSTSVSRDCRELCSFDSLTSYEKLSSIQSTLKQSPVQRHALQLTSMSDHKSFGPSETGDLSRQMGHLAAKCAKIKHQVGELQKKYL